MRRALKRNGLVKRRQRGFFVSGEVFCWSLGYLCRRIYCADRGFEAQYEGNYNLSRCSQSNSGNPKTVRSSANNFVYAIATLTFSGTYPTERDTLDFTQIADKCSPRLRMTRAIDLPL
jgi:hypothetical protein